MSWRSSQNTDLIVNNLTVNGKLTYANPDDTDTTSISCNEIYSLDDTNNINLSVANEIAINTQVVNISGELNIPSQLNVNQIYSVDETNHIDLSTANQISILTPQLDVSGNMTVSGELNATGEVVLGNNLNVGNHTILGVGNSNIDFAFNNEIGINAENVVMDALLDMNNVNIIQNMTKIQSNSNTIDFTVANQTSITSQQVNISGNLNVTGQIVSANTTNSMEFLYYNLTGDASSASGVMTLTANSTNTTNYAVYTSVYYGYSGSSGTNNAINSAGTMSSIVISSITSTNFTYNLQKGTGDNVNLYLTFMVVYNNSLDYPKSY